MGAEQRVVEWQVAVAGRVRVVEEMMAGAEAVVREEEEILAVVQTVEGRKVADMLVEVAQVVARQVVSMMAKVVTAG